MDKAESRCLCLGSPSLVRNGHPDFKRVLRREIVKPQRRQQTNHPARDTAACFRQAAMFRNVCSWQRIETDTDTLDLPPLQEASKVFARDAFTRQIARARYSLPLNKSNNLLSGDLFWHCDKTSALINICRESVTAVRGEYKAIKRADKTVGTF